jgi:2-dehydro-3-deoxyphosphooctonate aldolase (KDO 8-P synthase)
MDNSNPIPNGVSVGRYCLGRSDQLFLILGPCVIESEALTLDVAVEVARIGRTTGIPVLFKASFDKANRTSVTSFRGPGLEKGLSILAHVREKTGLPIVSDIHIPDQASVAGEILDVIQIPAFLCRQTDLLLAAGRTGKTINVKKGQFMAPEDMEHVVNKIASTGNSAILLTERGAAFGYGDLVADMRSILRMKSFGYPVVFDATHSSQFPGRGAACSSGERSYVAPLARAAVAAGADGIFMEVHPDPDRALCDGPNSLALANLESLVLNLNEIHKIVSPRDPVVSGASSIIEKLEPSIYPLVEKLKKIRLLLFDVDGVLTDGRITFGSGDLEIKSFDVRDGHGIKIAMRFGLEVALVTGRTSEVVTKRARDLEISRVYQGIWDKKPVLAELMESLKLRPEEVAVIGDDVVDIPLLRRVGVGFAVADAPEEVRMAADYVTTRRGGRGAAREMVEVILKAQGKWDSALARYYK